MYGKNVRIENTSLNLIQKIVNPMFIYYERKLIYE